MATLTGSTIASSYEQLLSLPDGGGNTTTLVALTDGDGGTTFCLQLATTKAMIEGNGSTLYFFDEGGESISADNAGNLTLAAGVDLNLTAATDINIPVNVGLRFGDGGENIETDNTDFTITSGAKLNLAPTSDVHTANGTGVVMGHTAQVAFGELTSEAQILGTAEADATLAIGLWSTTDALSPSLKFLKSGHASIGVSNYTTVADNEELGKIQAYGADGTDLGTLSSEIAFNIDDDGVGAGTLGGEILLKTSGKDGTLDTAVTITSSQFFNVGSTTVAPSYPMNVCRADAGYVQRNVAAHASQTGAIYHAATWRSANTAYNFFVGNSGNDGTDFGANSEHQLRGDGSTYNESGTYGNLADYAEFFETVDGNSIESGVTVKLNNGKIEPCEEGDVPIGVARPNDASDVIGNSAWNKWNGKYLRDDFGSYIREEISVKEWTDEDDKKYSYPLDMIPDDITVPEDAEIITHDGEGNHLDRRKINPDYDESVTYVNRQDRDEWCIVGLLGQVPITKGQPVADNWVKMKDVSDTVEMWFVK